MKRQPTSKLTLSVGAFGDESANLNVTGIGGRIKAARNALGLTQDALAKLAGSPSKAGLQHNESGRAMPGGQMIGTLVRAGINANWLLTGEGPMLLADLNAPAAAPVAQKINVGALEAIIEGAIKVTPNANPRELASFCAKFYVECIEKGLITPDGVGTGNLNAAA